MNGSNLPGDTGTYGTKGVASTSNSPPGLYNAAQWTDKQGKFWIFGGMDKNRAVRSDLWEYDPMLNTWTWVNGSGIASQPGIYGILGVPSASNRPGARAYGCSAWTDTAGDLWLFGGAGYDFAAGYMGFGSLNDLWRYHIASNEWTWVGGSDSVYDQGNYGHLYLPSDSSLPPSRTEVNTAWVDPNNNLWLFGGIALSNIPYNGAFCDIWRYSVGNGQWAWMGGDGRLNNPGNYGVMGVESPNNLPYSRSSYTHWVDSDYLYMTGGSNWDSNYMFTDVWRFNLHTNYWTWVGGDSGNIINGKYSHYCSSNYRDEPRGRWEQRSAQLNGCLPSFYIWGGIVATDLIHGGRLNDLWSFNMRTRKWRWVSGSDSLDPVGNFGSFGVSAPANIPPGAFGSCLWSDNNGNLWLWGGEGYNRGPTFCNAMWKYTPDPTCFGDTISVSVHGDTLIGYNGNGYQWLLNGVPIIGATASVYIADSAGSYTLQITNAQGCVFTSNPVIISGVVTGNNKSLHGPSIAIFPNPAADYTTIKYSFTDANACLPGQEDEAGLMISNTLGQTVYRQKLTSSSGYQKIDVSGFAAGLYNVAIVRNGGIVWAGKFVKE